MEDSLDGNATVNITAVTPRDDDTVDVNFTVVADPNVPATAEDLQDTAREQFNPTDELPLNKDTIKIRGLLYMNKYKNFFLIRHCSISIFVLFVFSSWTIP